MYKVLEVLEERYGKGTDSLRKIARSVGISRPTVAKYLGLVDGLEIVYWPLREESRDMERLSTQDAVEDRLYQATPGSG